MRHHPGHPLRAPLLSRRGLDRLGRGSSELQAHQRPGAVQRDAEPEPRGTRADRLRGIVGLPFCAPVGRARVRRAGDRPPRPLLRLRRPRLRRLRLPLLPAPAARGDAPVALRVAHEGALHRRALRQHRHQGPRAPGGLAALARPGRLRALPLLLLLFWQAALLSLHLVYFPLQLDGAAGKGGSKAHEVMPLVREDRLAKVFTAIFLGFIRHLVRTAWEAVSVLALQQEHRCSMQQATCVIALFYFLSYPVQMLYSRNRERLSEEGWMRLMVILAGAGAILLMLDSANSNGIFIFVIGSMLMYCALAVHATVSDSVGVRFADDSDALLNVENVIFMQVIAKGLIGRLMGPLAGRLSVVGGHFEGFAMLSLSLLVVSEVLTVFVIAGGKRNLDMMTALFSDGHAQALHTLTSTNLNDFLGSEDGREFARLKHGDVDVLRRAADSLAQLIIANERIRSMFAQDAQQVRIISPAYRNVPTAGVYLVRFLQEKLSELVGAPVVSCQVRRKKVSNGDFAAMTVAQRTKTLSQQFFIEEEQAVELHSKFCIFVDDAVVYGSHYLETCRMLSGHGVDCKNIFSVFIVRATEELLAKVPDAEHRLNERFPKDAASLQAVMSAPHFGATVRVIRLVLALQEQEFQALVHWLQVEKPELLRALSWGAMVESLKDSDRLPFLEPTDAASRV
mmetsp:Transcript_49686/g.158942  ORF Transcript_49686/g.158942 Transcript_49686/m.158942 type:complete len:680 (-) Transcript_49686:250-2289(-)